MEFISTWREKALSRKQAEIKHLADDLITVSDFDNSLFIAFQGNPLISLDSNLTSVDILSKLSEARNNFINAKLKD